MSFPELHLGFVALLHLMRLLLRQKTLRLGPKIQQEEDLLVQLQQYPLRLEAKLQRERRALVVVTAELPQNLTAMALRQRR